MPKGMSMLYRYRGEVIIAPGSHLRMEAASVLLRAMTAGCLAPMPLESAGLREGPRLPFVGTRGVFV